MRAVGVDVLELEREVVDGAVPGQVVVLQGRLTLGSVAAVREQLHSGLGAGTGDLVVDLSAVTACDASALAVLVSVHRLAGACGRRLVLTRVPPAVARPLLRSRLHRALHLVGRAPAAP